MKIIEPVSEADFKQYYQLRYQELRAPWHQPEGSERAPDDAAAIHALLLDDSGKAAGVCRLSFVSENEGQLRFMAIRKDLQNKSLGKLLTNYLEAKAKAMGAKKITLQAREKAVPFYERQGYNMVKKTHLLFGEIQHYEMQKNLTEQPEKAMDL
jgi:N-acetylglutamate synthase-like GNAT family acetyltransferase